MIVSTAQGRLEGVIEGGIVRFRGIPFAAAPVGERRFRPPEPVEPWSGVRPATRPGARSWQASGGITAMLGDTSEAMDEDCLFLDVTTPGCDDSRRPVMVWIHGGGFTSGSGSTPWYDGASLSERGDVVVVTINYRLGALGFLWLGDLDPRYASSGVNGLLDQAAALRWVRENIAAFGGDPQNVTIFGESAGAMSVVTHLALPTSAGLFRRAIAQSGAGGNVLDPAIAAGVTDRLRTELGVETLEELLAMPAGTITEAAGRVERSYFEDPSPLAGPSGIALAMAFQPVVDGVWLPHAPLTAIAAGASSEVELLTGTNLDEWNLFRLMSPGGLDHPQLLTRLERLFGDGHRVHDTYVESLGECTPDDLWSAVLTDATFRMPMIELLDARHAGASAPSWEYLFTWPTPAFGGVAGSCHALEIPFVFGVLENHGAELFLGGAVDSRLLALSAAMQDAWISFARHGDPGHEGIPAWPASDPEHRTALRFDLEREVLHDPHGNRRRLWQSRR